MAGTGGTGTDARGPRYGLLLLLAALPLLFVRLGAKDVWEASEGRPLESAREMRLAGDALVQRTNGLVDLTKPPVYAWATMAAFAVAGGDSEAAGRSPSVLATLGVLAAAFVLARRIAGPRAGFLAGLALLTTPKVLWQARLAELETLLALGVLWAWVAFDAFLEAPPGRRRILLSVAFHALVGFAFLVKGPVALLLTWPAAIAYAAATGRAASLVRPTFLAGLPATVLVGLSWFAAVVWRDPTHLDTFLAYAKGENVGHLRGPLYYVAQWPLYALPWTPLALMGLAWRFRGPLPPEGARRAMLPVVAFAVTFVLQSLLRPKQTHYLVPVVFPMGAVLAALVVERWLAARAAADDLARAVALPFALLAAIWVAGTVVPALDRDDALPWIAAALGAALGGTLFARLRRRGTSRAGAIAATAISGLVALLGLGAGWIVPRFDARMSSREFLAAVDGATPRGAPLGWTVFGSHSDYLWYLPIERVGRDGIPEILGASDADTTARVRTWLVEDGRRHAIVTGGQADALGAAAEVLVRDDAFQRKGRRVALVRGKTP